MRGTDQGAGSSCIDARRGALRKGALRHVVVLVLLAVVVAVPGAPAPGSAAEAPPTGPAVAPAARAALDGAPPTGGFHPLEPTRVVDSRRDLGIAGSLGAGGTAQFDVLGQGGVPAAGVAAVALNVTVLGPITPGATHLTLWPAGSPRPGVSTVNAVGGDPRANLAVVAPGVGGAISVRNSGAESFVVVDVLGWYDAGAGGGRTHTLPGTRALDTRDALGALGPGGAVDVPVVGVGGVPETGVEAVLVNVTVVDPSETTHLRVWPAGTPPPLVSTLNSSGNTLANATFVAPGVGGAITVRNASGSAHVLVDLIGWVSSGGGAGGGFTPVAPSRLYDNRLPLNDPLGAGEVREVDVLGEGGVPADGVSAVVVNVTSGGGALPPGSYLKAFTPGSARPPVSTANIEWGDYVAHLTVVSPGADGRIALWSNRGLDTVVVDVVGYVEAGVDLPEDLKADADRCDMLSPRVCMLPFPNDRYTVDDPTTGTGLRVDFDELSMPANADGTHVDPGMFSGNDGFSPGQAMLADLPQIDLAATGAPPITDIGSSLAADSPIVLVDATTGLRHPFFAELDTQADDPANRNLIVQPGVNLLEGHRYVVALRDLVAVGGAPIEPTDAFTALRDGLVSDSPHLEARRAAYERLFGDLAAAGVPRDDLVLAWDFTVASADSLAGRMLHIRDDAFGALGAAAPTFTVTAVTDDVDDSVARRVEGTITVPDYLTGDGSTGNVFDYGPDGMPRAIGTQEAVFRCHIPYSVLGEGGAVTPGRPVVYGHGLLGSEREVGAGNIDAMMNEHDMVYCATRWIGMSEEDILTAVTILQDMSKFPQLADRVQQGILNTLFMGRTMIHPDGFSSHPAFQGAGGQSVLDTTELFYDGNSQGGIIGGAATAVSLDWTRAVLGVPGMNYGILLPRSVDFNQFLPVFEGSYTTEVERGLILSLAQMLWDRAEANGYAQHMTDDPYPGTPAHRVLLHVAFADHQVSMTSAEIEARTIGAKIHQPALAPGRHHDPVPYWGIDPIPATPYDGSAIVIWDSGTPTPPTANTPPTAGDDPHEFPRATPAARVQKSEFLSVGGAVVDVCGGAPCLAPPP